MSHACQARKIQVEQGTRAAAYFLRRTGFNLSLAMFILTGKFPPSNVI
jgi:hypothetical protein